MLKKDKIKHVYLNEILEVFSEYCSFAKIQISAKYRYLELFLAQIWPVANFAAKCMHIITQHLGT